MLEYSSTCLNLIMFSAMAWGTRYHFNSTTVPTMMIVVSIMSLLNFFMYIIYGFVIGFGGSALISLVATSVALSLFAWAVAATKSDHFALAFDPSLPESLNTTGPFRFVRHPFYLSYMIFWISCAIHTAWAPNILMLMILMLGYIEAAMREGKSFLKTNMSLNYQMYKQKSGLFWPRLF